MKDKNKDIYIVGNRFEVDRNNFKIDLNKPYIIVCGKKAVGKSVYIEAMKNNYNDIQYLEVQRIDQVHIRVREKALKIVEINILGKKD